MSDDRFAICLPFILKEEGGESFSLASFPLVKALISVGSPSTVVGRISAIIVNPVQSHSRRAHAHVNYKGSERFSPPLAHRNTAPSIEAILNVICLVAPHLSALPRKVCWRSSKAVYSVRAGAKSFLLETSAAFCVTARKFVRGFRNDIPAIALAYPINPATFGGGRPFVVAPSYFKTFISVANSVNESAHDVRS